jgi:uncharacterized protein with HEPN domain
VNERDGLFLTHILEAIADIESFVVEGRGRFMDDRKTQSAVVRQLEIIGEAVKNLSAALTARESGVPWRQIAGARDRLIHGFQGRSGRRLGHGRAGLAHIARERAADSGRWSLTARSDWRRMCALSA